MAKATRHQKKLKSERAKVKLKTKGSKQLLPKGLNITDASFKVKKIVIREQLKEKDATEILSRRKLNVNDLLSRLQHYNSSVRQDAVKEIKEMLVLHTKEILNLQINSLLLGISALVLDKEKPIRREALKTLDLIFNSLSNEQLSPYSNMLISYLTCAMTHINQNIMEDSLLFLDILIKNKSIFIANNSHKILTYFLDMISKLHTQSNAGRQLTTNLNSKNTSMKWRTKVLNSLQCYLSATIKNKISEQLKLKTSGAKEYYYKDNNGHFPIYSRHLLEIYSFNNPNDNVLNKVENGQFNVEELKKYTESLMPLLFDSWLEVCPKQQNSLNFQSSIPSEASLLLSAITSIIESIIKNIELLENKKDLLTTSIWFKSKFQNSFVKNLLTNFPYAAENSVQKSRKRQEDFTECTSEDCLEQNLILCKIYIWFTSISDKANGIDKNVALKILEFIMAKLENWSNSNITELPQLMKVLKALFLKAYKIWNSSKIPLDKVLATVINTYLHKPKKNLQLELFSLLKDIMMDRNLESLHSDDSFKEFIKSLPDLLLQKSVHDTTIKMLNRIVLQYRSWIQKELEEKCDAIIGNAKTIEIIGSENEKESRLMICNLFYFMDEQVYY